MQPDHAYPDPLWGLPDPDRDAAFYADVPLKRLVAWVLDSAMILLLCLVALPLTAFTALFFFPILWLAVGLGYRILTLSRHSATLGMRMMGIELRTHRGERFGAAEAMLHTLLYTVSVASVVPQIVSIGAMLATARGQGLPDLLLGTAAINRGR